MARGSILDTVWDNQPNCLGWIPNVRSLNSNYLRRTQSHRTIRTRPRLGSPALLLIYLSYCMCCKSPWIKAPSKWQEEMDGIMLHVDPQHNPNDKCSLLSRLNLIHATSCVTLWMSWMSNVIICSKWNNYPYPSRHGLNYSQIIFS